MGEPVRVVIMKGQWPVPSESPACLKLLTWLRMAQIPYEEVTLSGPPKSKTGKAPYVVRPDGTLLDDSSVIIETLTREHGVTLDADRDAQTRALMTLVQRTVECHLYFVGLLHRWRDHPVATREAYFGASLPYPVRVPLAAVLRRRVLAQAHGQGLGRRPDDQVAAEAREDLDALLEMLGDDEWFFGSPGVTDAIVYGALENARAPGIPGTVHDTVRHDERWTGYLDRVKAKYWAE